MNFVEFRDSQNFTFFEATDKFIKGEGNQFAEEERKKKGKKGKIYIRKKNRERGGERKSAFRRLELVGSRSKVHILDEGYTLRGRDSSYFGLFSTIRAMVRGCVFTLRGCLAEF